MSIIQNSTPTNQMGELAFKLQLLVYYSKLFVKTLEEQTQLLHQLEIQKDELEKLKAIAETQKNVSDTDN